MSISSFMRFKSQGAPLLALPVFLKRGIAQRSLFCAADSAWESPRQLTGKRVGLVNYTSSMPTWVRGVLAEEYQLSRVGPQWISISPPALKIHDRIRVIQVPEDFTGQERDAWEEVDGYPHPLERREHFLLTLMEQGEVDAVISYQVKVGWNRLRPLLRTEDELWSYYLKRGVYPINHIFVIHADLVSKIPDIGAVLLSTLRKARSLWVDYLPEEKRKDMEIEMDRLGWDPFAYRLGQVEKRTLETFMDYLLQDGLISEKMPVEELFLASALEG